MSGSGSAPVLVFVFVFVAVPGLGLHAPGQMEAGRDERLVVFF